MPTETARHGYFRARWGYIPDPCFSVSLASLNSGALTRSGTVKISDSTSKSSPFCQTREEAELAKAHRCVRRTAGALVEIH